MEPILDSWEVSWKTCSDRPCDIRCYRTGFHDICHDSLNETIGSVVKEIQQKSGNTGGLWTDCLIPVRLVHKR